ncbi:MAG: hypothetical protein JWR59_2479 [Brevundimonas sp.]|nr:hypothetical protein [Brevundimonas sp.]
MILRVTLPAGDLSKRLAALGWSMRGFAAEIGEDENTLRTWNKGVPCRADVVDWIEREERHRKKNPIPVRPGREAAEGRVKQRRRPPARRDEDEPDDSSADTERAPVAAAAAKPSVAAEPVSGFVKGLEAPGAEDLPLLLAAFRVPDLEPLPPLLPRPAGRTDGEQLKLLLDWLGWSPRAMADAADAPSAERDFRRWAAGTRPIGPDVKVWLEAVVRAVAKVPREVSDWQRLQLEHQRLRGEVMRRCNLARDLIDAMAPADAARWEAAVMEAIKLRPAFLVSKAVRAAAEDEGSDPKRPMTLREIL